MATTAFEVVVPCPDDAEELASVHIQAWREAYGGLLPERFYDDAARDRKRVMWSGLLAGGDAGERVRVARHEGRIVGLVARGPATEHQGHPPRRGEQLYALYVLSTCYGDGVGQALLDEALSGRPAQLWVAKENRRARRFYEKNGFAYDGTEQVDPDLDGLIENACCDRRTPRSPTTAMSGTLHDRHSGCRPFAAKAAL
ncbi:GNAT family N-acetyltransferase [Pedococcus sp. 5OH_020]|uniref:GNAT family N-acetyltransferase n=1 Tax=Pedococcus sp. 5OH_020 TaxID=2989814 RepID=UPI0022E99D89|nr:GNAT family N-acetyltransferase [Pedococcus sp. 5OH_020]